jgi:hypothetical protein
MLASTTTDAGGIDGPSLSNSCSQFLPASVFRFQKCCAVHSKGCFKASFKERFMEIAWIFKECFVETAWN